jgi:hypothetical protein
MHMAHLADNVWQEVLGDEMNKFMGFCRLYQMIFHTNTTIFRYSNIENTANMSTVELHCFELGTLGRPEIIRYVR